MKRSSRLILLVFSVLLLGTFVLAETDWEAFFENYENGSEDKGAIELSWVTEANNTTIPIIYGNNPKAYNPDTPTAAEKASITLNAVAYIPTYVKLELTGNAGKSTVRTFGPITIGESTFSNDLIFDNEIGGFVDSSWNSVGHGKNIEIGPEDENYIQASDYLQAVVFSNDNYKYEVVSSPLISVEGQAAEKDKTLNLEMGYNIKTGSSWGEWGSVVFDSNKNFEIKTCTPLETLIVMHRFRVPYNDEVVAGKYEGTIYFKVYTL